MDRSYPVVSDDIEDRFLRLFNLEKDVIRVVVFI